MAIPKLPTHAVKMVDNSMGDGDVIIVLAYQTLNGFFDHQTGLPLLQYAGDDLLAMWELDEINGQPLA